MKYLAPALLLLIAAAQTDVTNPLDWQWNRDTPICALQLKMTPSGGTIEISRTPGNEETEIKLTVQPQPGIREGHVPDGAFRLNSGDEVIAHVSQHVDDKKQLQIYGVTQDPTFISKFSNASSLEISNRRGGSFPVDLRSAAAAAESLRNCEGRKMREWGIDPVAWRGLTARPIPLKPVRERFSALTILGRR